MIMLTRLVSLSWTELGHDRHEVQRIRRPRCLASTIVRMGVGFVSADCEHKIPTMTKLSLDPMCVLR